MEWQKRVIKNKNPAFHSRSFSRDTNLLLIPRKCHRVVNNSLFSYPPNLPEKKNPSNLLPTDTILSLTPLVKVVRIRIFVHFRPGNQTTVDIERFSAGWSREGNRTEVSASWGQTPRDLTFSKKLPSSLFVSFLSNRCCSCLQGVFRWFRACFFLEVNKSLGGFVSCSFLVRNVIPPPRGYIYGCFLSWFKWNYFLLELFLAFYWEGKFEISSLDVTF